MEQRFPYTIYRFSILISKWTLTTFYLSFCASETDIMACGACKYDCCFAKFFAPEDAEMFGKLKLHFPVIFMRERLSDVSTTKEYKKQCVQEWKARVNAKGKEKQAGSSSSKNEKNELQASKCQAASTSKMEVIAQKKGVQGFSSNEMTLASSQLYSHLRKKIKLFIS